MNRLITTCFAIVSVSVTVGWSVLLVRGTGWLIWG